MVVPFGLLAIGALMAYSGLKGKSIIEVLRNLPGGPTSYEADARAAAGAEAGIGGKGATTAPTNRNSDGISHNSVGGYHNPTPSKYWQPSVTDQGLDFGPKSPGAPVLAIGDGKVVKVGAPGWPGGGGVVYQLTSGARRGQYIYVYEDVNAAVKVGQHVSAGQVIARSKPGSSGIEMGFSDASGTPLGAGYAHGHGDPHTTPGQGGNPWGTKFWQFWKELTSGVTDQSRNPHLRSSSRTPSTRSI